MIYSHSSVLCDETLLLQRATAVGEPQHRRNQSIDIDNNALQEHGQSSESSADANVRLVSDVAASPSTSIPVQSEAEEHQRNREEWAATYIQTAFRGFLVKFNFASNVHLLSFCCTGTKNDL